MEQTKERNGKWRVTNWLLRTAGLLLGLGLMIAISVCVKASEIESNNTPVEANEISINSTVTGCNENYSDKDYYKIVLPEDGSVSVTFSHEYDNQNWSLWTVIIYDENDNILKSDNFKGPEHVERTTIGTGLPAGTYYILVKSFSSVWHSDKPYTMRVNFTPSQNWEKEGNNSVIEATQIQINEEVFGSVWNSNDKDYYRFTIPEDGFVSISYSHEYDSQNWSLWTGVVYDNTNAILLSENFRGPDVGLHKTCTIGLPAGTYYFLVKPFSSVWHSDEPYSFVVNYTAANNWEREFNDTIVTANQIEINKDYSGSIARSEDKDYYQFALSSMETVKVGFSHEYVDSSRYCWRVILYDNNKNNLLQASYKGDAIATENTEGIALQAGIYYVCVEKRDLTDVTYTFRVSTENTSTQPDPNTGNNNNGNIDNQHESRPQPQSQPQPQTDSGRVVSDWARAEVDRADAINLIPASISNVDLRQPINRGEFAAVAVKVYESLAATSAIPSVVNPFTDTADPDILRAYNIGTVNGMTATTYQPYTLLNREQCATMLTRVFKRVTIPGWTLNADSQFRLAFATPSTFEDDALISDYARESVYFMAANGIINGMGNNVFAPRNITSADEANHYANATREQAIAIALRMVENLRR